MGMGGLADKPCRTRVDRQYLVELCKAKITQRSAHDDSGIADHRDYASHVCQRGLDDPLDDFRLRTLNNCGGGSGANRIGSLAQITSFPIGHATLILTPLPPPARPPFT